MLSIRNLTKTYQTSKSKSKDKVVALNNVSIDFPEKGLVFLLGKSGSGKSTLLNSIGGLDTFDSGEIIIKGKSSKNFSQSDFDSYRNTFIGFIFQEYNILEEFSVAKNLALAIELQGKHADKDLVNKLLEQVEMLPYAKRKPNQLSGGQKQRVAIARALIKNPEIIMADEPTGALDSATGKQVMDTLKELSKEKLVIIVSHDREFAEIYGDRIIELKDGKVIRDVTKKEVEAKKTDSGISIIEDRIIHIKKGQKLSYSDLDKINEILQANTENSDTVISLNREANIEIKKSQSITEDGNQEVFLNTEPEDVPLRDYSNKKLNLIKSKLKFKDSFKMGASALKNKVGKLVFTILLSFVAFAMFGLVDTLATFNRPSAVYSTVTQTNQTKVAMRKEKKDGTYARGTKFKESDMQKIAEKFTDIVLKPVIGRGSDDYPNNSINLMNHNSSNYGYNNNPFYNSFISGIVEINGEEDLNKLGFELVYGALPNPENEDEREICISKHLFDVFKNNYEDVEEYADIIGYEDSTYLGNCDVLYKSCKIVGIIDDKTDISKYSEITTEQINNDYMIAQEMRTVLSYGYTNAVYVTSDTYQEMANSSDNNYSMSIMFEKQSENEQNNYNNYMYMYYNSLGTLDAFYELFEQSWNNGYHYEWNEEYGYDEWVQNDPATITDFLNSYSFYYKGGDIVQNGNFVQLAEDEMIVNKNNLSNFYATEEEIETAINEGLKFNLLDEVDNVLKEIKIVGYYYKTSSEYYNELGAVINNELKDYINVEFISGYDYVMATLSQNADINEEFIKYCETYDDTNVKYTIQNGSTGILDQFGGMFETLTEVFTYVGIGFAVFASFLLMNFISTSISYKKREIGVLRALGARGSDVFGVFFNESLVIALINFVLATISTFVAAFFINNAVINDLGINLVVLTVGIRQIVLILGVSLFAAFISSLIPVLKITKKKPIDAINNR